MFVRSFVSLCSATHSSILEEMRDAVQVCAATPHEVLTKIDLHRLPLILLFFYEFRREAPRIVPSNIGHYLDWNFAKRFPLTLSTTFSCGLAWFVRNQRYRCCNPDFYKVIYSIIDLCMSIKLRKLFCSSRIYPVCCTNSIIHNTSIKIVSKVQVIYLC